MKTIRETVDLPDAAEQPLVHPLDLVESRRPFIVSWWLSFLAAPSVVFLLAAVLWTVSNNYVTPILIPLIIAVGSGLLSRVLRQEAWAYIPRKRQDTSRPLPGVWSALSAAISTVSLLSGLVLLTFWVVDRGADPGVLGYILGTGIGIIVLIIAGMLWTAAIPTQTDAALGGWGAQWVRLIAVSGAVVLGYLIVDSRDDTNDIAISDLLLGAGVIIAIQVLWWLIAARRSTRDSARTNTTPT